MEKNLVVPVKEEGLEITQDDNEVVRVAQNLLNLPQSLEDYLNILEQ